MSACLTLYFFYKFFFISNASTITIFLHIFRGRVCIQRLRCWWQRKNRCFRYWWCSPCPQHQPNPSTYREIGRKEEAWWTTVDPRRISSNFRSSEKGERTRLLRRFPWMFEIVRQSWRWYHVARWIAPYSFGFGWVLINLQRLFELWFQLECCIIEYRRGLDRRTGPRSVQRLHGSRRRWG